MIRILISTEHISGNISSNPSFRFTGMLDSIKTFPLHLTPEPMIARGQDRCNYTGDE